MKNKQEFKVYSTIAYAKSQLITTKQKLTMSVILKIIGHCRYKNKFSVSFIYLASYPRNIWSSLQEGMTAEL